MATLVYISIFKLISNNHFYFILKHFQWLKKKLLIYFQAIKSAVHVTYVMLEEEAETYTRQIDYSQPANPS